eukprot:6809332-Alexandrium_andersonii.AAC.1
MVRGPFDSVARAQVFLLLESGIDVAALKNISQGNFEDAVTTLLTGINKTQVVKPSRNKKQIAVQLLNAFLETCPDPNFLLSGVKVAALATLSVLECATCPAPDVRDAVAAVGREKQKDCAGSQHALLHFLAFSAIGV